MKKSYLISTIAIVIALIGLILFLATPRSANVVIVVFGNYSSGDSSFAQLGYNAAFMMSEEINDQESDIKYAIERVDSSEYSDESDILARFEELNADIILGPFLSSSLVLYADMLLDSDYVVFVPSATHDVITNIDDTVYRLMNATSNQAHQTAEAFAELEYDNIFLMYDTNNQMYTKEIVDYLVADDAMSSAITTLYEITDTSIDLTVSMPLDTDVIFLCGPGNRTAESINNMRDRGVTQPIFICTWSDTSLFLDTIEADVEDVYMYSNRNIQLENAYNLFSTRYLSKYDTLPSIPSTYAYESLYMIHAELRLVDFDVDALPTRIDNLEEYRGQFVTFYTDGYGDFYSLMALYEVNNKAFARIPIAYID